MKPVQLLAILIEGQGLFAAKEIAADTDLGITHYEVEKDAMSPKILIPILLLILKEKKNTRN